MNILSISGTYWKGDASPEASIADMLRYDDGELISWTAQDIPDLKASKRFNAEVHTNSFTPERWKSFGLKATLIRKEKGQAKCAYPDAASVRQAINERR